MVRAHQPIKPARIKDYLGERTSTPAPTPALTKIVERERLVVERLVAGLPARERELIIREYTQRTKGIMTARVPQAYAALLRGAEMVKPASVLRPDHPRVRELMATAKAIRAGRLPFVPKEVVARSRELLTMLFGKEQAQTLLTSRDVETRRLISRQRLVPRSVRAAVSSAPLKEQTRVQRELQQLLARSVTTPQSTAPQHPMAPAEFAQLEAALPALHTGGTADSGEYRMQTGESVHVITRNDALMTVPSPGASGSAPRAEVTTSKIPAGGRPTDPKAAPPPASSVAPPKNDIAKASSPFSRTNAARTELGTTGTAQTEQALKVRDIEGLTKWIADAEERLNKLDG
jgi:hypothetical protein